MASGNNEAVAIERSLNYDMLWSEWEEMKEKCMPDDIMQNWLKAVMKKILNESREYILEDQFNEILSQGFLLQNTKKLVSQVSINNKGEITTNFQFDTKRYRKKVRSTLHVEKQKQKVRRLSLCSRRAKVSLSNMVSGMLMASENETQSIPPESESENMTNEPASVLTKFSLFQPGSFNVMSYTKDLLECNSTTMAHNAQAIKTLQL